MKKKTYKIIICISLVVMLFASFSSVFAETNPYYKPSVPVSENALDKKIGDSVLLDVLANMINAIASLIEFLIGSIFSALTGDNIFPWADRIIFNGIGFLDINFLNAADNSLFLHNGEDSILGEVVKSVYTTIFSLAVLFLGVAVGVMAIRLAISSIAAEKAKYKQAIVNWLTCMVLLFLMHYILAFVFWVNEQMVTIASGILLNTIEARGLDSVDFDDALNSVLEPEERVKEFCKTAVYVPNASDFLNPDIVGTMKSYINDMSSVKDMTNALTNDKELSEVANSLLTNEKYIDNRLIYVSDNPVSSNDFWKSAGVLAGSSDENAMVAQIGLPRLMIDAEDAKAVKQIIGNDERKKDADSQGYYQGVNTRVYFNKEAYLNSDDFLRDAASYAYCATYKDDARKVYAFYQANPECKITRGNNPQKWQANINNLWATFHAFNGLGSFVVNDIVSSAKSDGNFRKIISKPALRDAIATLRLDSDSYIIDAARGTKAKTTDIIANLGSFFKKSAYVYTTEEVTDDTGNKKENVTGWRASKVSVTGALLYAIFIFQSCMYLIMYVKRLFYVIMLAMFGPIVVIYDFFMKSAGG